MSRNSSKNRSVSDKGRSSWHRLFGALLKESLKPVGIEVFTEVQVVQEPPKADVILIRREGPSWSKDQKMLLADGIRDTDAQEVLIEFKYSESLNEGALRQLLVYDHLYRTSKNLENIELQSFLVSSRTPQKGVLARLGFELSATRGVYTSRMPLIGTLQVILLNELADRSHNAVLKCFASRRNELKKAFVTISRSGLSKLSQTFSLSLTGLRRLRMGEIAWDPDTEEWTPESLMELGREWIEEVTLKQTLQKGVQEGAADMLLELLEERFGTLPNWVADKMESADHAVLKIWMRRALKAGSLEELFVD